MTCLFGGTAQLQQPSTRLQRRRALRDDAAFAQNILRQEEVGVILLGLRVAEEHRGSSQAGKERILLPTSSQRPQSTNNPCQGQVGGPARSLETWEGTLLQAFLKGSLARGSALATLWERGHSSESPICWDMVVSGRLETPQWRLGWGAAG